MSGLAKRQLTERAQIVTLEKPGKRLLHHFRFVDRAALQAVEQGFWRHVDRDNFRRLPDDPVRYRFSHLDAGDLPNLVIKAFDVLDIHGGPDFNPRIEQDLDVFPALGALSA